MKNRPMILIVAGLLALIAGCYLQFTGGPPKADAALVQECRASVNARGPGAAELLPKCDELAFARMMTARDATSAASGVAAANRSEIGNNSLGMFLIGLGIALTLGGAFALRRRG